MMNKEMLQRAFQDKRYFAEGLALGEPTLARVRANCLFFSIKSLDNLAQNLDVELALLSRFDNNTVRLEQYLTMMMTTPPSPVSYNSITGAQLLEVQRDFFTRFSITSGLMEKSLSQLAALSTSFQQQFDALIRPPSNLKKSAARNRRHGSA
jgi:hypothetical protein